MTPPPLRRSELTRVRPRLLWIGALLWIGLMAVYELGSSPQSCSARTPCGADWLAAAYAALVCATVGALAVGVPAALAVVGLTAVATVVAVLRSDPGPGTALSLVALVVVCAATAGLGRLDAARDRPAPGGQVWPGPPAPTRGGAQVAFGWVLLALAALTAISSVAGQVYEHRREAGADRVSGTVASISSEDGSMEVVVDDHRHTVGINSPQDWVIGQTDLFFVDDGGAFRPVAYPYDASFGVAFSVGFAAAGLALMQSGRRRRRRDLQAGPLPVRAVRVQPWGSGVLVYEGDDVDGSRGPIARIGRVSAFPSPEPEDWERGWTEQALVYGLPRKRSFAYVRTRDALLVPQDTVR